MITCYILCMSIIYIIKISTENVKIIMPSLFPTIFLKITVGLFM